MPDLYFKVGVVNGKATLNEMKQLDQAYNNAGQSGGKQFREADRAASVFGGTLGNIKGMVLGLGATFGAIGLAGLMGEWVRGAMEAEKTWANVTTLLDGTKQDSDELYKSLKSVSSELGSTKELAQGMYYALSANIKPAKAVEFVATSAKFAKAALVDIATSTDLLTTVVNAYGMKTEDAILVSDKLFQMVRKGKTTGADLAASMGTVIPTAAALEVDMNQLGAAFATMTQSGLNAHMTTTGLNQALITFLKPTKQAKEMAASMGIELSAESLKAKGLAKSLGDLAKAVGDDDEKIAQIFGNIRALRAALALTGEQAGTYVDMLKEMEKSTGLTDKAVEKQVNTVGEQLDTAWRNVGKTMKGLLSSESGKMLDFLKALNKLFTDGVVPINEYTAALTAFGLALVGLKIGAFVSSLRAAAAASSAWTLISMIRNLGDLRAALQLAVGSLGAVGQAALVAGVAFAAWKFGRWISEVFDLDNKLGNLWKTLGLFQGRVKEANEIGEKTALKAYEAMKKAYSPEILAKFGLDIERNGKSLEEWQAALGKASYTLTTNARQMKEAGDIASLQKQADFLKSQYGPVIKALGIDVERGTRSIADWKTALDKAAVKVREGIPLTEDEKNKIKELSEAMFKAANPASELANNMALLGRGHKSTADFVKAFSKQILDAIVQTEAMGGVVPKSIMALKGQAQAFEDAREKAAKFLEEQKKLKELNKKGVPRAIAGLDNPELQANARAWIEHAAAVAKSKDATLTESEALQIGVDALKKYDDIVTKNKENLKEQLKTWMEQHSFLEIMKKDYDELGISLDKSTILMERAYNRQKGTGLMSIKAQTDALSNMVSTSVDQHEKLSAGVLKDLEDMAFNTDINVREKMMPVWQEYYKSLRDSNGQFPVEYQQRLIQVMTSNDRVLKSEMYPAWQEYVESVKKVYGTLPPGLDKLNTKIVEHMDDASGKMAQVFKDQVSTIFTDFSKGVADMIFESKSMSETIVGILKEFGKMAVRTLMESFMSPIKKMMTGLVDDLSKALQGGGSTGGGIAGAITGGGQSGGGGLLSGVQDIVKGVTTQGSEASAAGGFGNTSGKYTSFLGKLLSGQGADFFGGKGSGAFFEKGGGLNGKGVGGPGGSLMSAAGMMMAMDSLNRKGLKGAAEGAIGGGMAGYAMGGLQGAGIGAGGTLFMQGMLQGGGAAWAKAIGGGALVGFSIAGPIGAAIGAAVGAIAKGIKSLVGAITGPNSYQAASKEIARDYGGVKVTDQEVKTLMDQAGISESKAWDIRKNITMSPAFLKAIGEQAQQQGKMDQFLKSLENVGYGVKAGDYRAAYEEGELTGDWTKLNDLWSKTANLADGVEKKVAGASKALMINGVTAKDSAKTFMEYYKAMNESGEVTEEFTKYITDNRDALEEYAETSQFFGKKLAEVDQILVNMKEHAAELSELKTLKNGFESLKQSLNDFQASGESAIDTFLNEGIITEQFRQQVEKLGGDISKFEQTAGLLKISKYFGDLVDTFKETGIVTDDLRRIMKDFGADMSVLDNLTELQGLKKSLASMNDFRSGLQSLFPEVTGLQKVLQGVWDEDTISKLRMEGLDPSMFEKITKLVHGLNEWEQAIADFQQTGRLTEGGIPEIARQVIETAGLTSDQLDKVQNMFKGSSAKLTKSGKVLTEMLQQYGGAEGAEAVRRLGAGFTTVTTSLLETTKANMEAAYKSEREGVLAYIDQAQSQIQQRSDEIQAAIEGQFDVVSKNIQDAFATARVAALEELDKIIEKIKEVNDALLGLNGAIHPSDNTGGTTGDTTGGTTTPPGGNEYVGNQMTFEQFMQMIASSNPMALSMMSQEQLQAAYDAWAQQYVNNIPQAASGALIKAAGLIRVHEDEQVLTKESTSNLASLLQRIAGPLKIIGTVKPADDIIQRAIQGMNAAYGSEKDATEESIITRASGGLRRKTKEESQTGSSDSGAPTYQAVMNNYGTIIGLNDWEDRTKKLIRDTLASGSYSGVDSGFRR